MDSIETIENRHIMMIEHDGRDIPIEIRGPSQEKEEHFFYAVVDFLLKIQGKGNRIDSEEIMREKTWLPQKPKTPPKPKVADNVLEDVDAQIATVVAKIKARSCQRRSVRRDRIAAAMA